MFRTLTHSLSALAHRVRCRLSPQYNALHFCQDSLADLAALTFRDAYEEQLRREEWANDVAAQYRLLGHDMPVGTVIAGVTVTR
jgi:hypothetical protein